MTRRPRPFDKHGLDRLRRLRNLAAADAELTTDARVVLNHLAQPWDHTPSTEELATLSRIPAARTPAALAELDAHGYLAQLRDIAPHLGEVRQ